METEEKPTVEAEQPAHISFSIIDSTGHETHFKARPTSEIKKVIAAYHKQRGTNAGSTRFLFEGSRIDESKTIGDLGIEDGNVIDALLQQVGGVDYLIPRPVFQH